LFFRVFNYELNFVFFERHISNLFFSAFSADIFPEPGKD
jgi:hypothetical protein